MQSFLGLPFPPQGAGNNPMVGVINFIPWLVPSDHVSQTKPTTPSIVFSVKHREGSGGFSEGFCVWGMHSEEKLIASF